MNAAPEPRAILIVRLSAIGDVVMAAPLACALRDRYPAAHLAWLAQPGVAPLIEANPAVDEVIPCPLERWRRQLRSREAAGALREIWALGRRLRARRFDWAIDIHGLLKSAIWVGASGAPQRIGLAGGEGTRLFLTRSVPRDRNDPRLASEYRAMAAALGLDPAAFRGGLAPGAAARAAAARWRTEAGIGGRPFAVLCPFTTRPQKHWRTASWVRLARGLERASGVVPVVLGGPDDVAAAEAIAAAAGGATVSAAGRLRLVESAALIGQSRLLIGVDTGLTHMGHALAVPTIALFGATRPYLDTGRPASHVIYHPLNCSPCRRRPSCGGAYSCMHGIGVDEVLMAARALGTAA
ncbi:MAG: glycosyltransferase family 9 protein [Pseudomonadota bacterium]|nr:glycosyltransferase family 9 protein [Pseudomonadota bacterium]HJO35066.1 glycosyltransferase family 9 protein [Gammaproteobacteria bacterium]